MTLFLFSFSTMFVTPLMASGCRANLFGMQRIIQLRLHNSRITIFPNSYNMISRKTDGPEYYVSACGPKVIYCLLWFAETSKHLCGFYFISANVFGFHPPLRDMQCYFLSQCLSRGDSPFTALCYTKTASVYRMNNRSLHSSKASRSKDWRASIPVRQSAN